MQVKKFLVLAVAFGFSFISDAHYSSANFGLVAPGYLAVIGHALASGALEHTIGLLTPSLGSNLAIGGSTVGAVIIAMPIYLFRLTMVCDLLCHHICQDTH